MALVSFHATRRALARTKFTIDRPVHPARKPGAVSGKQSNAKSPMRDW